jgi:hypothetical protein
MLVACDQQTPSPVNYQDYSVSGVIKYQDKAYSETGFSGVSPKPVRYAEVDIVDSISGSYSTVKTDLNGNYSFSSISLNEHGSYYLRVNAIASFSNYDITVNNFSKSIHAASLPLSLTNSLTISEDIIISNESVSGAFNILDVMTAAFEYVSEKVSNGFTWESLNIYWQDGRSDYGSYTCDKYGSGDCIFGRGVYVLGGYDSDEFDDDVLLHEFGHVIETGMGVLDSPGFHHDYTDNGLDMRLSWSEGFAGFIQADIKDWLHVNNPNIISSTSSSVTDYIDTIGNTGWHADFLQLNDCNPGLIVDDCYIYASNEIAVSKVIWQTKGLLKSSDGSPLSIIQNQIASRKSQDLSLRVNLEMYWEGLLTEYDAIVSADLTSYENVFKERSINYLQDQYENQSDDISALPTLDCTNVMSGEECRSWKGTLYRNLPESLGGSKDKDIVAVMLDSSKTYNIETSNMRNGADTYLSIYSDLNGDLAYLPSKPAGDEDDVVFFSGARNIFGSLIDCPVEAISISSGACMVNNGDNLRSRIIFNPNVNGTYYIEVKSTPDPEPALFAGNYGDYTITVSVQ